MDMVDPQPTLVDLLVRHVLLPRELLPQIEINSIERAVFMPSTDLPATLNGQKPGTLGPISAMIHWEYVLSTAASAKCHEQGDHPMQIVDAQIHVWGSGLPSNQAHRQVTAFTTEEAVALMDEGGVDAAVIHPPGWDPGASAMAFAAVHAYPGRFAVMGAFPLDRPENRGLVATWRQQPGMLGLRYGFLNEPLRGWLADGTLDWLWDAAERAGVPIAMLATDSLTAIGRIAERHPGLRLTIDHLGGRGATPRSKMPPP